MVEKAMERRRIPGIAVSRIDLWEGGFFSAKREYLRIQRGRLIFDIGVGLFGTGFFFSWRLKKKSSILGNIHDLIFPPSYYRIDTDLIFQATVEAAILEVVDALTTRKGVRRFPDLEKKPIMKEFYQTNRQ